MKNCFEFQPRRLIVQFSRWKRTRQDLHRQVVPVKRLCPSLSASAASPPPRRGGSTFIEGRFAAKSSLNLPSINYPFVRIELSSGVFPPLYWTPNNVWFFLLISIDNSSWSWFITLIPFAVYTAPLDQKKPLELRWYVRTNFSMISQTNLLEFLAV